MPQFEAGASASHTVPGPGADCVVPQAARDAGLKQEKKKAVATSTDLH